VVRDVAALAAPAIWLARINFMVAAFNLVPGFPLDGGRVLRALVGRFTGSLRRSGRAASAVGQMVAFGFIAWGDPGRAERQRDRGNLDRAHRLVPPS
jgi:Zn-dependent protease